MAIKTSLYIATPSYDGTVNTKYLTSILGLQGLLIQKNIGHSVITLDGCSMLAHARNVMVRNFLKSSHSHMLFVDADMGFNPNDILKMLAHPKHEVSGVLCPKKAYNWETIRKAVHKSPDIDYRKLATAGGNYSGMFFLPPGVNTMPMDGSPIEVHGMGTGIMLIARTVLERIIAKGDVPTYTFAIESSSIPIHEFFRFDISTGFLTGEDIYFCNLARRHGATLYGFAGFSVTHTGPHTFVGDIPAIAGYYDGPIQAPMSHELVK